MSGMGFTAVAAPLLPLVLGALVPKLRDASPARTARFALYGAIGALAAAALTVANVAFFGTVSSSDLAGLPLRVDALSAMMLATISLIGTVVARFALRYLAADRAQGRFSFWLSYTLAAILTVPIAENLIVFFIAWVMSSHGLHNLLTLYPERPAAQLAAHKKFLISRLGDLFLGVAFLLIYVEWGALDFTNIFEHAAIDGAAGGSRAVSWISVLLVLGAMTKSAQVPLHTWLPDTMETPTPVSALMHAGIINAGGFLVIRLSPLLIHAPAALTLLALVGGVSALIGSLVMLTQNDVKRKLAYSTISQMGFMMLQCGLGAFGAAMLHLAGHSFYKAHAFLSAGSWVNPKASSNPMTFNQVPPAWLILLSLPLGILIAGASVWLLSIDMDTKPGGWVLISILGIALAQGLLIWSHVIGNRLFQPRNAAIALGAGMALSIFYLAAVSTVDTLLGNSIAREILDVSNPTSIEGATLVSLFLVAMLTQSLAPSLAREQTGSRLYVLLRNGFYLSEIQNRWVVRFWPVSTPIPNPTR